MSAAVCPRQVSQIKSRKLSFCELLLDHDRDGIWFCIHKKKKTTFERIMIEKYFCKQLHVDREFRNARFLSSIIYYIVYADTELHGAG